MNTTENKQANQSLGYWLKKIDLLERVKAQYISTFNFTNYKKACKLQEKIVLKIRSPHYQEKIRSEKNPEYRTLSQKIKKQVEVNQILLDDIKDMSQEFLSPFHAGYYDRKGNVKKTTKVFTANV